jgi:hypothetical protein
LYEFLISFGYESLLDIRFANIFLHSVSSFTLIAEIKCFLQVKATLYVVKATHQK